jgi:thiosulfate/3-mercaptopyruvate sulfurtransferase
MTKKDKNIIMSATTSSHLVTIPDAIAAHKKKSTDIKFIDGSWHMPIGDNPRNGRAEFITGPRIHGALYFDIDDIAPAMGSDDNPKKLPHMKPSAKMFASAMDRMKIKPSDTLYVYATLGCAFYHRAYWTLRSCGHDPNLVKLVQGSLDEWKKFGGELEEMTLVEGVDERLFRMKDLCWEDNTPTYQCVGNTEDVVVDMHQVLKIVNQKDGDAVIVDARAAGRFDGTTPEPRPGLRAGHMPGALNVPFTDLLLDTDKTKFRPMDEVRDIFIKAGISQVSGDDPARKVVCSCGSGVTAAALAIGLEECGLRKREDISIYDGSWIEWGSDDNTPIVTSL